MPRAITRSRCLEPGCLEESYFKRRCKAHYMMLKDYRPVKDYCFTWNIRYEYCGTVRAYNRDEARLLVLKGILNPSLYHIKGPYRIKFIEASEPR